MTDRRFVRTNARVAHTVLAGQTNAPRLTDGTAHAITATVTDLLAAPGGARDKQMLFGHAFTALDRQDGWAFGFDPVDGYVGYVRADALGPHHTPTHQVHTRHSHIYTAPDFKSPERKILSLQSALCVTTQADGFATLAGGGFVPTQHIRNIKSYTSDATATAETLLGTPYLWGGNSGAGIDCSGLVQLALHAAGIPCPRDSDLQHRDMPPTDPANLQRGDLVFWQGHVGMMRDATTLIHANAHHMAVATESLATAIARISQKEFGAVTGYARPSVSFDQKYHGEV